jgi:glucokinase
MTPALAPPGNPGVIALDLGGTRIKAGIVRDGKLLAYEAIDSHSAQGLAPRLPDIEACARRMLEQTGVTPAGIGVSTPGIVDVAAARIRSVSDKYPDATDMSLRDWAKDRFDLPLAMENDARMALLGEQQCGAGRGVDDVVMVTLGTGIGVAAMIGGQLVRGAHGQAAIVGGHIAVRLDGDRCSCGNVGCAETEASVIALPRLAVRFALSGDATRGYQELFAAAAAGDAAAIAARDHSVHVWSVHVVSLIHVFDPTLVILGGGIMGSADHILPAVSEYVRQHAWTPWGRVQVVRGELGDTAALLACESLVTEQPKAKRA